MGARATVGPFGDQGLDGEYVPGRARLSFGLGRFPVEASCTDWGV